MASRSDSRRYVPPEWRTVESPVEETLYGVVTTASGPVAVGESGRVVVRTNGEWTLAIPAGASAQYKELTDVAVTDDGERVWFAGGSGALGYYDVEPGRKTDYTAPMEKTTSWSAIAVTGTKDDETVVVANSSGEILSATLVEADGDDLPFDWVDVVDVDSMGKPDWDEVVKPHTGARIEAAAFDANAICYAVDTSGNAFARAFGREGSEWRRVGIRNAQVDFYDIYAGPDTVMVAGEDGLVFRYDPPIDNWTPIRVGEEAVYAVDRRGSELVAVGESGRIYQRLPRRSWQPLDSPTEADLRDACVGDVDAAVGAGGTIIERTWQ
ncbi:hypothetical protein [Halarchaeum sp. P4]|uniref:hypothetical protein n=1 Tax=Halarchaeum sp. P4 TaxID=3421639 RepID=UPI003EBDFBDE